MAARSSGLLHAPPRIFALCGSRANGAEVAAHLVVQVGGDAQPQRFELAELRQTNPVQTKGAESDAGAEEHLEPPCLHRCGSSTISAHGPESVQELSLLRVTTRNRYFPG